MDRIALIGIDGLSDLSSREDIDSFPAFNKLISLAANGVLENEIPLTWDRGWELALHGSVKAIEENKNLINVLPTKGISTRYIYKASSKESTAEQILANNVESVLQSVPKFQADRVDLLVIQLRGFYSFLEKGGNPDPYWQELDKAFGNLLDSLSENTIFFTIAPVNLVESNTGIYLNQWLMDEGYTDIVQQNEPTVEFIEAENLLRFSGKGLEQREEVLEKLRTLKVYARRGTDLKVIELQSLPENLISSHINENSAYISTKKETIYLDSRLVSSSDTQRIQSSSHKNFYSSNGQIFVSGYKVDGEKSLKDLSVLSIVPTIRDCFNLEHDYNMIRSSFKYQFSLRVVEEKASGSGDGDESAVRSRLEALGY